MISTSPVSHPVDRWIPWMVVLFFVVIAVLDGIFVALAVRTAPGTVTDRAYEEGLAYNNTLAAAADMAALKWRTQMALEDGVLSVTLADATGAPLSGAALTAKMIRPVQEGHDFETALTDRGDGVYAAPVSFPLPGQWRVRIFATWQGTSYQHSRTLIAP